MDYLIVLGFAAILTVIASDEIWYRWERRNLPRANRFHVTKPTLEYLDDDELFVISNDTDEVVFSGSPGAVYDWLQIYQGVSSLDVFNRGTAKKVRASQFKAAYVD
jgi:hypothetical protein